MDLSVKNRQNMEFMLEKILGKLKLINSEVVKPDNFHEDQYDDLYALYQYIMKRTNFSPSEVQALAEELGKLRK